MHDPHNLQRFVDAQQSCYDAALGELQAGQKRSHWMWYIFPQLAGLGRSPTAGQYAIQSLDEATAYLAHSTLGPRLVECTNAVLAVEGRSAEQIFGFPDYLKFRSSMTLFSCVPESPSVFQTALDQYYNGESDPKTIELLDLA